MTKLLKALKITGITVTILIVLAIIGVSGFTGYAVTNGMLYQNAEKDTHGASYYQLEEWGFDWASFESEHTFTYDSVDTDDYQIPITLYDKETADTTNTVLLVHPYGGDHVSVYPQAKMYLDAGWNVVAIDQRSSGRSETDVCTFGALESKDLAVVVDYLRTQYSTDTNLFIHGVSMGAATTGIYSGTEHAKKNIDGIIMDSSYDCMETLFLDAFSDMDEDIPGDYAVFCGNIVMKLRFGFTFDDAVVTESLKNCQVPTLIIHSIQDSLPIDIDETHFETIPCETKTFVAIDCPHIEGFILDPETYTREVMEFTNEVTAFSKN